MSLPACQQRALDTIENTLQKCEPRMAAMFAMFTRLNRNEGVPRTERLVRMGWRAWFPRPQPAGRSHRAHRTPAASVKPLLLIPVVVALLVSIIFLGVASSSASCTPAIGPHGLAASHSASRNCASAPEFKGVGHP